MKAGVPDAVRAAGGEIYAITSEPQSLANNAADDWQTEMVHVGDPHHEISGTCRERGWLDLFVNEKLDFLRQHADWPTHPKGRQPAKDLPGRTWVVVAFCLWVQKRRI